MACAGAVQKKSILLADISLEGELMGIVKVDFSGPQSFRDFLARSGIPGLRQRNPPEPKRLIVEYDEVQVKSWTAQLLRLGADRQERA